MINFETLHFKFCGLSKWGGKKLWKIIWLLKPDQQVIYQHQIMVRRKQIITYLFGIIVYKFLTIAFSCHCTLYIFAGDLSERIGARLHDLSQLQLESGKRSHLSRANISKSSRLVSALKEKQTLLWINICVQLQ